jgi:hypothetical protein
MTQDEMERWLEEMRQFSRDIAASRREHEQRLGEHQERLQEITGWHAHHEDRLAYAEETLRQVLITQQAIKNILERLNGR